MNTRLVSKANTYTSCKRFAFGILRVVTAQALERHLPIEGG